MAKYVSRLRTKYQQEVFQSLKDDFKLTNPMQVPHVTKVTLNMGLGEAITNSKLIEAGVEQMTQIAGQKPLVTKAKKSIAAFKLREFNPIGVTVTLRGERMYDFLDRLINLALPRVRDFRGIPTKSFDGRGNFTLGLKEQTIFPEVDFDKVEKVKGMNITIGTSSTNDEMALALLRKLGLPFKKS
jgi:large subunit ribosomal protein L5